MRSRPGQAQYITEGVTTIDDVAAQIVRMAKIAWNKHVALLVSLIVAPMGALLIGLAGIIN
jgi:hypothetical protein